MPTQKATVLEKSPELQELLSAVEDARLNTEKLAHQSSGSVVLESGTNTGEPSALVLRDEAIQARNAAETAADLAGVAGIVQQEADLPLASNNDGDVYLVHQDSQGRTEALYQWDGSSWNYTGVALVNEGRIDSANGVASLDSSRRVFAPGGLDTRGDVVDGQGNTYIDHSSGTIPGRRIDIGVSTVPNLKSLEPEPRQTVLVKGYNTEGDGGGGLFWWDDGADASKANGGTTITSTVSGYTDGDANEGLWKRVFDGPPTARMFGAMGNTNQVRDELQALIDAADQEAYIQNGTYRIDGQLNLPSNFTLRMDKNARLEQADGTYDQHRVIMLDEVQNVEIIGGVIDGRQSSSTVTVNTWQMGIEGRKTTNVTIRGSKLIDCSFDGIYFGDTSSPQNEDVKILNNVVEDCLRNGITITGAEGCVIDGNDVRGIGGESPECCIIIEPNAVNAEAVRVVNNFCENSPIGINAFDADTSSGDVIVANNTTRVAAHGIEAGGSSGAEGTLIVGNHVIGGSHPLGAIRLTDGTGRVVCKDNLIEDAGDVSIHVENGQGKTIEGNKIVNSSGRSIEGEGTDAPNIIGNVIQNAKDVAIFLTTCNDAVVQDNIIRDLSNQKAVDIGSSCAKPTVKGNLLEEIYAGGIKVDAEEAVITNNTFVSVSTRSATDDALICNGAQSNIRGNIFRQGANGSIGAGINLGDSNIVVILNDFRRINGGLNDGQNSTITDPVNGDRTEDWNIT